VEAADSGEVVLAYEAGEATAVTEEIWRISKADVGREVRAAAPV